MGQDDMGLSACPIRTQHQDNKPVRVWRSYSEDFGSEADVVLPGDAEHIGQVKGEVDDSSTGGSQVSAGERRAEQETLHDGYHSKGAQEEEDHARVAVGQQVPLLLRTQDHNNVSGQETLSKLHILVMSDSVVTNQDKKRRDETRRDKEI